MKKCLLLLALVCLLGNRTLAEDLTIDFSTFGGSGQPNATLGWENTNHPTITQNGNKTTFSNRFWVNNPNDWGFYGSSTFNQTYLQKKNNTNNTKVSIGDMKTGDVVTIWGESGDQGGGCNVTSNNIKNSSSGSTNLQFSSGTPSHTFTMSSDGTLELEFYNRYSGIRKITVQSQQQQQQQTTRVFNYDPGFEVYDMFEVKTSNGVSYSTSDAGFTLNGGNAQYVNLNNANITLNERIAVNPTSGWSFNRGLQAPNYNLNNNNWYNFSICNLKEGDRVEIFWTGDAPTFSSQGQGSAYNGSQTFLDENGDGILNNGDHIVSQGEQLRSVSERDEGTLAQEEGVRPLNIYTSSTYVISQDGHLDLGIKNGNRTRIVKIKIYSDHQATMVDYYDQPNKTYGSVFDITGELQAKEHIVPGGLEVHVGNNDPTQHAIVVASKYGPMSYVNAVDRFKIPGITKSGNNIQINFNLKNEIPQTGTFYKFIAQEEGDMTVKFQGNSIYYYRYDLTGDAIYYNTDQNHEHNDWRAEFDRANEQTFGQPSTYYLMEEGSNGAPIQKVEKSVANGSAGEITYHLEKGKVYYLYGVWSEGAALNDRFYIKNPDEVDKQGKIPYTCGVAELYDVEFTPTKKIHPLAKWVPSGTQADEDLADVTGYVDNDLTIKKMTGNITACTPYIKDGKLMIKDIQFAEGKNPAGVVLIKIGDKSDRYDPVYAFTVAYSADAQYDDDNADGSRGHTWDFSTNSLNGLEWTSPYNANGAVASDFGTYFNDYFARGENSGVNSQSLLAREMNYTVNNVQRSDWMLNYRIQRADGTKFDPRFLSKYDMEGDNADMIYDTEGMVLLTSSNQACIFNEFKGNDVHSSATDPDRYVGILPGGSFLIPWLEPEDRVIIWMGSGVGTGNEQMVFNIENAYDAKHTLIKSTDEYVAGGSQWNGNNGDNNYRGCYHFFAKDKGDMVFRMIAGSMCKIYKIQIYRGDRIKTNDLVPADENSPLYFLNAETSNEVATGNYTIQYRGKGEAVDGPEVVGKTGNLKDSSFNSSKLTTNEDKTVVTFTSTKGDFGVFNMRLNDMERNNKYVADFADHNFPIGYYEEMQHPYTWDFTDANRFNEGILASEYKTYKSDGTNAGLNIWDENTKFNWYANDKSDMLFAPGGQIYATDKMIAETRGIQFTPLNMNMANATLQATNDGLIIDGGADDAYSYDVSAGDDVKGLPLGDGYDNSKDEKKKIWEMPWEAACSDHPEPLNYDSSLESDPRMGWKITIPNFPNLTAAYIRVGTIAGKTPKLTLDFVRTENDENGNPAPNLKAKWNYFKRIVDNGDGTKDIIIGVSPSNSADNQPLSFILNNVVLKKIATSKDIKYIGKTGYATESRHRPIDHRLSEFFTNEPIKAYQAYFEGEGESTDYSKLVLEEVNVMPAAPNHKQYADVQDQEREHDEYPNETSDNQYGYGTILYHSTGTELRDGNTDKTVDVIDGGFHLFVPDMHDLDAEKLNGEDYPGPDDISKNVMIAKLYNENVFACIAKDKYFVGPYDGNNTNLILSAKKYAYGNNGADVSEGYEVFFVRVDPKGNDGKGAKVSGHSAYMQIPTDKMKKLSTISVTQAKMNSFFGDDPFGDVYEGIATGISEVTEQGSKTAEWYTIDGRKLNGMPTQQGLYIVNGKKVMVK